MSYMFHINFMNINLCSEKYDNKLYLPLSPPGKVLITKMLNIPFLSFFILGAQY